MISSGFTTVALLFHSLALFGSTTTIQSYICQPPIAPTIMTPVQGSTVTATVPFTITGQGTASSSITVSSDNVDTVDVTTDQNGTYSTSITVTKGEHTLSVSATNPCGSATGDNVTITAVIPPSPPDTTSTSTNTPSNQPPTTVTTPAPDVSTPADQQPTTPTTSDQQHTSKGLRLSIESPANNSSTTDASIFVSGSTSSPSTETIKVNGAVVASTKVAASRFGTSVPLILGKNTITVTATNGNSSASVILTVTRTTSEKAQVWYQTPTGKTVIRVAAVSTVSIIFVLFIIGLFLL